jgi:hypothetical protein
VDRNGSKELIVTDLMDKLAKKLKERVYCALFRSSRFVKLIARDRRIIPTDRGLTKSLMCDF